MECLVYIHYRNNLPFYVGMGKPGRERSKKKRSDFHLSVWNKAEKEKTFECGIIFRGDRKSCSEIEKTLIYLWGKKSEGGSLCNFADGGDGGNTWCGPNVEERRQNAREFMLEVWKRPEYREKHSHSMKTSQKVKDNCRNTLSDPEVRERHKRGVQKVGKYSQKELDAKYGSDKKGGKWYYNTEEDKTKIFQSDPGKPWVPGRKKPTA